MMDPSPTVIWFPSLASQGDVERAGEDQQRRPKRRVHTTRLERARRAEDERARLIRLIG
jgi:hypothetical protein